VSVDDPGRITDKDVGALLSTRQPDRSHKVTEHEHPDAVTPGPIERLESGECFGQGVCVLGWRARDPVQLAADRFGGGVIAQPLGHHLQSLLEDCLVLSEPSRHLQGLLVGHFDQHVRPTEISP
jgi:hypothetical protein